IVTDPVSSATSPRGRLVFGAGVGVLVYVIRVWGNYPDAVAFAVLLMNLCAPTIDYYTAPRTYGHARATRGMGKGPSDTPSYARDSEAQPLGAAQQPDSRRVRHLYRGCDRLYPAGHQRAHRHGAAAHAAEIDTLSIHGSTPR